MTEDSQPQVHVDLASCEGHGMCEDVLPEVFHVSDEGKVEVLDDCPSPERRSQLKDAAAFCPTGAIAIYDR